MRAHGHTHSHTRMQVTGYTKGEMMGNLLVDAYAIKEEFKGSVRQVSK